jgi:hypothetical protein
MSNATKTNASPFSTLKDKLTRTSGKIRWNVFGLNKEDHRDPAALTFARLGLLAYRW